VNSLTSLHFNPRRSSIVSLHDSIHQELFARNERVVFIHAALQWFPSSLYRVKQACFTRSLTKQVRESGIKKSTETHLYFVFYQTIPALDRRRIRHPSRDLRSFDPQTVVQRHLAGLREPPRLLRPLLLLPRPPPRAVVQRLRGRLLRGDRRRQARELDGGGVRGRRFELGVPRLVVLFRGQERLRRPRAGRRREFRWWRRCSRAPDIESPERGREVRRVLLYLLLGGLDGAHAKGLVFVDEHAQYRVFYALIACPIRVLLL
jgi:hypothetical protein